jgi:hypothetical protein
MGDEAVVSGSEGRTAVTAACTAQTVSLCEHRSAAVRCRLKAMLLSTLCHADNTVMQLVATRVLSALRLLANDGRHCSQIPSPIGALRVSVAHEIEFGSRLQSKLVGPCLGSGLWTGPTHIARLTLLPHPPAAASSKHTYTHTHQFPSPQPAPPPESREPRCRLLRAATAPPATRERFYSPHALALAPSTPNA